MRIWKEFTFDSAHRLPNLPPSHKCSRLHGHTYRFRLHVEGPLDPTLGWIVDFGGLVKAAGELVHAQLDHYYLNEIPGLENPTAEILAQWIWRVVATTQLGPAMDTAVARLEKVALSRPTLVAVELFESCTTGVWYEGGSLPE